MGAHGRRRGAVGRRGVGLAAEHPHALGNDLRGVAVLAVLALPPAGLQAALEVDQGALLQELRGDLRDLAEQHHAVPFGAFLSLAVLVLPGLVGGDRQIGDGGAFAGVAHVGVAPEVTDDLG